MFCLRASLLSATAWLSVLAEVQAERKDIIVKDNSDVMQQLEVLFQALRVSEPRQILKMFGAKSNEGFNQPPSLSDEFSLNLRGNLLSATAWLKLAVQSSEEDRIIIWGKNSDVANQLVHWLDSLKELDPNGVARLIMSITGRTQQKPTKRKGYRTR